MRKWYTDRVSDVRRTAKEVWTLAWPAATHMLLVTCVFVLQRAMLGRHSATSLAAMQICGPLVWTLYSVFASFSVGTLAVVGRSVGAGDPAGARAAAQSSLGLAVGLGTAVGLAFRLGLGPALDAAFPAAGPEVRAAAHDYLAIALLAMPAFFVEATCSAALQGLGDTRTPLLAGILANAVSLVLTWALVFGHLGAPALGMRGAAIAAAVAILVEALVLWLRLGARLPGSHGPPAPGALRRVLAVSGPAFAEKALYHVGFLGFVALIGRLGPTAMAANQALIAIESIAFLLADGFGVAAGALVAQKLGAALPDEASRAARLATAMAALPLLLVGLAFLAFPAALVGAFSPDAAIVELGAPALRVGVVAEPVMGAAVVLAAALRGAGDTRTVLGIVCVCALGVRLLATWAFAFGADLGLVGIWLGSTTDWAVRLLLLVWAFRTGGWRRVRV